MKEQFLFEIHFENVGYLFHLSFQLILFSKKNDFEQNNKTKIINFVIIF